MSILHVIDSTECVCFNYYIISYKMDKQYLTEQEIGYLLDERDDIFDDTHIRIPIFFTDSV